ncbi:NAD(P)-dependent alcohol dehydrogenase [Zunongwangia sp. F363]|uniref:NAD(P)-dependent alcohol dehydrogenase n=1 Tax=Autumnicola tepida TaxID=3075595 RepID=A0ABU3CBX2_9FLAO|nr:NAD(P)-dependent alcohol dehydrogenase [Zunongwangia sp. F363]MDT0643836.1 NAD(P)-dependent alcohol dehydrogenase [Zunongwangia sp. F363]
MKAVVRHQYGSAEVLNIEEVKKPVPGKKDVLIRVYYTTVNRTDCAILTGKPFIMKLMLGLPNPRKKIPGTVFSGVVEETGSEVKLFKTGDRVWGFGDNGVSSQAEFLTYPENRHILKLPEAISFEQAAAAVEGGHYAYNFINKIQLKQGQKVLINGATGAIGSAALQFVKSHAANTVAVCKGKDRDLVKSLGADEVIDYTKEDFTQQHTKFDYIFDTVGKSRFSKCKHLIKNGGAYISSELGPNMENLFLAFSTNFKAGKQVKFPVPLYPKASMKLTMDLMQKGKFNPLIDRHYPLDQIKEAYQYVLSGEKTGNVLIPVQKE